MRKKEKLFLLKFLFLISFCISLSFLANRIYAVDIDSKTQTELQMIKGDLASITVYSLVRVSVTDPEIADISSVEPNQILMVAKKAGQTSLFVWDENGKRNISIRVDNQDVNALKTRLDDLLKKNEIKGISTDISQYEGKIILTGWIHEDRVVDLDILLDPFEQDIMNFVKEQVVEDLIQVDVQIVELTKSYSETLGFDWPSAVAYKEDPANFVVTAQRDLFKVGPLSRTTQITAELNAIITQGKGRVLSKPKLVVVSGKEASFLVGGEIPITTTTTSTGGNVQQNVEFKDYGITLTVTPTIKNDNKIEVDMIAEVSDIDQGNAVGENVAFTTRSAQTQLVLDDGQTVVLAGLIKQNEGETITKVPFLGDIPILGTIFRKKTRPSDGETELVITLTPTILNQHNQKTKTRKTGDSSEDLTSQESVDTPEAGMASQAKKSDLDIFIESYSKHLQKTISQAITYPPEAREQGWEGTTKLTLHILEDGSLVDTSVKESSGYSYFDKNAVNTAQDLAPYKSFPDYVNLEELIVTVPITYSPSAAAQSASDKSAESIGSLKASYSESIQKKIAESIVYPEEAREYGWEGTVKLVVHILNDGTLLNASVKESSGYELFDESAVETAKNLAPYAAFPTGVDLEELNLIIPIVFSLERR